MDYRVNFTKNYTKNRYFNLNTVQQFSLFIKYRNVSEMYDRCALKLRGKEEMPQNELTRIDTHTFRFFLANKILQIWCFSFSASFLCLSGSQIFKVLENVKKIQTKPEINWPSCKQVFWPLRFINTVVTPSRMMFPD